MTDELTPAPPDLPPERPGPPPLRIHHLFLWTFVLAALLIELKGAVKADVWQRIPFHELVIFVVQETITSAGATLALLSIYWQKKGYAAFAQPGQWLLILTLYKVLESEFMRAMGWIGSIWSFHPKGILLWNLGDLPVVVCWILQGIIMWAVPAAFYFVAARRAADTRPWRVFLVLSAIGLTVETVSYFIWATCFLVGANPPPYFAFTGSYLAPIASHWFSNLVPVIVGVLLLAWAIIDDRVRDRPRYWTHWAGASLPIISRVIVIALTITR